MDKKFFDKEVDAALKALQEEKIILYPTDTIWGLGCDATNETAVNEIYKIKNRSDSKSMIILVADEKDILQYVAAPDLSVFDFLEQQTKPTTIIFEGAIGLAENLLAADGSIAIRIVKDEFCRHLIKRLHKPIVSTSANKSGEPAPKYFPEITSEIKNNVHHIVHWRQGDETISQPSQIIKWNNNGTHTIIRS